MNTKLKMDTEKSLRKKAVLLAKTVVKTKAGYACCYCKKRKPYVAIHAHHIYNEGVHRAMSADTENIISVCFTHHNSSWNAKEPSFHKNPMEMADWFRENYPERAEALRIKSRQFPQVDKSFWENKLKELTEEYKKLCQKKKEQVSPF